MPLAALLVTLVVAALPLQAPAPKPQAKTGAAPFKTRLTVAQMTAKQAVLETSAGTIVIDLRPDLAAIMSGTS